MTVVLACQLAPVLGDPAANRDLVADAVMGAADDGAEIVVLPELASSGYSFADTAEARDAAERPDGVTMQLWARLARDRGIVIVGGFCEEGDDGAVYNSAAILEPEGATTVYRKVHLWDRERLIFTPGDQAPPVVESRFGRVATMICYDLEFPEWVRIPALSGAQLLAAPVNWPDAPRPDGERPAEVVRVQADASVNRMCIAACDRVGPERDTDWVGGSVITDADGWVQVGGWPSTDSVRLMADVDLAATEVKDVGGLSNIHRDRRPALYRVR